MIKKILAAIAAVVFAIIHFCPMASSDYKVRNIPFLLVLVGGVCLFFFIRYSMTLFFAFRTVSILHRNALHVRKCVVLLKTACIVAEDRRRVYVLHLYHGVKQRYRYHFEENRVLEIYKTTQTTFSTANGRIKTGGTRTERAKRKKLCSLTFKSKNDFCDVILFDRFPESLTDCTTDLRRDPITEGESICRTDTLIYSLHGFANHLEETA